MHEGKPPESMARARRAIDGMSGITQIGSWQKIQSSGNWTLELRLRHGAVATTFVPEETAWVVEVANDYPLGEIRFFPAFDGGIEATFQHQRFNGRSLEYRRDGEICLSDPLNRTSAIAGDDEPLDHNRLMWRTRKAIEWLNDAATGNLMRDDDWFELPDFPGAESSSITCAFLEEPAGLGRFPSGSGSFGIATLLERSANALLLVKTTAQLGNVSDAHSVEWGAIGDNTEHNLGIWILMRDVPVSEPWRPPSTFGELAEQAQRNGINLIDAICKSVKGRSRDFFDYRRHLLLVGFPVRRKIKDHPERIHWQALRLPQFVYFKRAGFRSPPKNQLEEHVRRLLTSDLKLEWIRSENWVDDQLTSRGALPADLSRRTIAIIGCGALGSSVGELLVRGGCRDITLVDRDEFRAGNAVRHTLTLASVGYAKANSVAARLNMLNPAARVSAVTAAFPAMRDDKGALIRRAQVVIDTTGSDQVLHACAKFGWSNNSLIASASIGYKAKRLFFYAAPYSGFSVEQFRTDIQPWLRTEQGEMASDGFPREGLGCWHPVFPARADDIWLASVTIVKLLESAIACPDARLTVLEQPSTGSQVGFLVARPVSPDSPE